jgi:hypothetical protein
MGLLTPSVKYEGEAYVLITQLLAGVPRGHLGAKSGALAEQRDVIFAAMDFLMTGF